MKFFVQTERLILREILTTDIEGMYELDADTETHRYLGNRPINNKDKALAIINLIQHQYIENGIGRWAIIEKETNNFIGWTGLKLVKELTNNHINYYDLGYRLIRKYWGRGFATESAIASLSYSFDQLNIDEIYAAAHIENIASNKILKNIGFQMQGTFTYDKAEHNWYKINKPVKNNNEDLYYPKETEKDNKVGNSRMQNFNSQ